MLNLVLDGTIDKEMYISRRDKLSKKIKKIEKQQEEQAMNIEDETIMNSGKNKIKAFFEKEDLRLEEFDEKIFETLVHKAIIGEVEENGERNPYVINFVFKSGFEYDKIKEKKFMKIGIDLDGVVIDSETTFRTYEEIFDIDTLKGNNLINREEPKFQARYNWTSEQEKVFIEKYFLKVSKESNIMSGFLAVYNLLKKQGHEFVVITARGGIVSELKDDAIRLLNENNIKFDKYYWKIEDKLEICKNENVDIMIDDDWRIIRNLSDNKIKTLYFRDTNLMKLDENEYIKEVNNWGDIYRYISDKNGKKI